MSNLRQLIFDTLRLVRHSTSPIFGLAGDGFGAGVRMAVMLNGALVAELITSAGGVTAFLRQWGSVFGEEEVPDRQTVYNWRNGQLPRSSIRIIRLAHLLDVDPFCLLAARNSSPADAVGDVFQSYQLDSAKEPGLQFLRSFFGWKAMWPPTYWEDHQQQRRQDFTWHQQSKQHDPAVRANYYPVLELRSEADVISARPQTFHFAFSGKGVFQTSWLHYGFVVRRGRDVQLLHIHGHTDNCQTRSNDAATLVETWFGPGPTTIRVVSRHPFSLEQRVKDDGTEPRVRFPG